MAGNVTDSSGDSVSKVPRDPAAADKAAQDESVPAAKQSDVADDKTARGPEGGSGGGGGEPPEPSITHLTDAPVYRTPRNFRAAAARQFAGGEIKLVALLRILRPHDVLAANRSASAWTAFALAWRGARDLRARR